MDERRVERRYIAKAGTQLSFVPKNSLNVIEAQDVKDISSSNCAFLSDNAKLLKLGQMGTVFLRRETEHDNLLSVKIERIKEKLVALSFQQTSSTEKYKDKYNTNSKASSKQNWAKPAHISAQIYRALHSNVGILAKQIIIAQVSGFLLILFTSIILGGQYGLHAICSLFVLLATVLYFLGVYFPRKFSGTAIRLQKYRNTFGLLIGLDIFIILSMIGLSGGIKGSHLVFVLGLIPPIVGYVRGGGKTMFSTSIGIVIIICLEVYGTYCNSYIIPSVWCGTLTQKMLHFVNIDLKVGNASLSDSYPIACGFGLLGGIILTLIQSHLAIFGAIPDQIISTAHPLFKAFIKDPEKLNNLIACVQYSYKKVGRVVSLTNIPELHCSEVHPLRDVVFQALIFALPGVRLNNSMAARRVAEMVFAVHWLDDVFDHLGYSALASDNWKSIKISSMKMNEISKFYHPYGINRVVKLIKGNSLFKYERSKWAEGIESGLLRVVLAGFIQSGNIEMLPSSKKRLRMEIEKFVTDSELKKVLKTVNTSFCWGVSKTAMPLVLGMYWNPKKIPDIGDRSLILDALFMPLSIWHNLREEIRREKLPQNGFDKTNHHSLILEIEKAVQNCVNIIDIKKAEIVQWGEMWDSMKSVLLLINVLYGSSFPKGDAYDNYKQLLKELLE